MCTRGACEQVILKEDSDLLAMAPTGSGKTAVALLAILQAFARGKRAIYTSPIKALSNQKFAEFKEWFRKKGVKGEVWVSKCLVSKCLVSSLSSFLRQTDLTRDTQVCRLLSFSPCLLLNPLLSCSR